MLHFDAGILSFFLFVKNKLNKIVECDKSLLFVNNLYIVDFNSVV